jgi:hypothetical protein
MYLGRSPVFLELLLNQLSKALLRLEHASRAVFRQELPFRQKPMMAKAIRSRFCLEALNTSTTQEVDQYILAFHRKLGILALD